MKAVLPLIALGFFSATLHAEEAIENPTKITLDNPKIDVNGFSLSVKRSERIFRPKSDRSLSEQAFIKAAAEKGVVVLDARSADKYRMRHIVGAVNLPFTDFTAETLAKVIPSESTKVLIYCNNNFEGSPVAFPSKAISTSLNLHTAASLDAYGYTNVYQLGPLLNVKTTQIQFEGTELQAQASNDAAN